MTMTTKDWNYWLEYAKECGVPDGDIYYSDEYQDCGPNVAEARLWDQFASADDSHDYMLVDLEAITNTNNLFGYNSAVNTANYRWVAENWEPYVVDAGYRNCDSHVLVVDYVLDDPGEDDADDRLRDILGMVGDALNDYPVFDEEMWSQVEDEWKVSAMKTYIEDWSVDYEPLADVPASAIDELAAWVLWYSDQYWDMWFDLENEDMIIPAQDAPALQSLALRGYKEGMPYNEIEGLTYDNAC